MRGVQCFSLGVVTVEVLTNKQAEEIPRVEFSMSGRNKHAHMGIGAVDEKKLRPMLDAVLAGDDPAPAALVEMAMACLKSVARDRPLNFVRLTSRATLGRTRGSRACSRRRTAWWACSATR